MDSVSDPVSDSDSDLVVSTTSLQICPVCCTGTSFFLVDLIENFTLVPAPISVMQVVYHLTFLEDLTQDKAGFAAIDWTEFDLLLFSFNVYEYPHSVYV